MLYYKGRQTARYHGGNMGIESEEFKKELAGIVRGCVDEVIASDVYERVGSAYSPYGAPAEVVRAWAQYEHDRYATAIENDGNPEGGLTPCSGIDLFFAKGGHDILAPAVAAERQVYSVGVIMDIIREHFSDRPAQLDAATSLFVKAVRPYIMVNVDAYVERINEGIDLLGRKGQVRFPAVPDNALQEDDAPFASEGLTAREEHVVRLVTQGKSNCEIAAELGITQNTVKNHIRHILEKTGVENRVQLSVLASRRGLC